MRLTLLIVAILMIVATAPLSAQWLDHPDSKLPRTADGRPDLSAPAPTLNGVPDLSGIWESERTPNSEYEKVLGDGVHDVEIDLYEVNKYLINVFWPLMPPPAGPFTPAGRAAMEERSKQPRKSLCLPAGLPQVLFVGWFKLVQTPDLLVSLGETGDPPRQIFLDGRALEEDPNPSWEGYSVGHWEDGTLVVETNGMNTRASLDAFGHPFSESLLVTERYTRRDFGHMDLEILFNDPEYYTEPFSIQTELTLQPDTNVLEFVCNENERDLGHMQ